MSSVRGPSPAIEQITIVGAGAVGRALAAAFTDTEHSVDAVISRTRAGAREIAARYGVPVASDRVDDIPGATTAIALAVPDDQIESLAHEIAAQRNRWDGVLFFHTSGVHTSGSLNTIEERGGLTASAHPLQSFSGAGNAASLAGVFVTVEGGERALIRLQALLSAVRAVPMQVAAGDRPAIHLAAVLVSNYLVTLFDAAAEVLRRRTASGITPRTLVSLAEGTVRNLSQEPVPIDALTGPIARGDAGTIRRHLDLLAGMPELERIYRVLGERTLQASVQRGLLKAEAAEQIGRMLSR